MKTILTYFVDAFTDTPFKGNPAGVCILKKEISADLMQKIAGEINFSETAFLIQQFDNQFSIRYFTPETEIDFCGHATLAAAKVIFHEFNSDTAGFTTKSKLKLKAFNKEESIEMDFPLYSCEPVKVPDELTKALGIQSFINTEFSPPLDLLIIEVSTKEILQDINPDFKALLRSSDQFKECVVTAASDDKAYDFYSRCFCPWIGIDEDPVTGAVHSSLASYWSGKLGKQSLKAYQLSARGGFLNIELTKSERIRVESSAIITFKGKFYIP